MLLSFWRECADPDLPNVFLFARFIRDLASPTEEVYKDFLMNLC